MFDNKPSLYQEETNKTIKEEFEKIPKKPW